jgi:ubiquitin-activating enzyme E1
MAKRTAAPVDSSSSTQPSSKRAKMSAAVVSWGEWMGSWKVGEQVDQEAERIDRQKAAFGGDTVARLKDLNVLIIGVQGVGVETAKNLILSNVGGVVLNDTGTCQAADRGTNFYITDEHVAAGATRADASLSELRSLNPFCRVDVVDTNEVSDEYLLSSNVLGTGRPFAAVVVSTLLPKDYLFRLNETARSNGIAFVLAANHGVTASLFSDFGPQHEIADATGEPTQTLAVSNVEVLDSKPALLSIDGVKEGEKVVIVTVAQAEHGLDDGDTVAFDDLRDDMATLNGKQVKVKRVAISSPVSHLFCVSDACHCE